MGQRGPKPKPRKVLELKGRSHNKKKPELDAPTAALEVPKGLPKAVRERAQQVADWLLEVGISSGCDASAFQRYCEHLMISDKAAKALKKDGVLTIDERGLPRKHPAVQIHRENSLAALRFEEHFGLTPSARARLHPPENKKDEDPYEEYRRARSG